jgi:hypothetical protein
MLEGPVMKRPTWWDILNEDTSYNAKASFFRNVPSLMRPMSHTLARPLGSRIRRLLTMVCTSAHARWTEQNMRYYETVTFWNMDVPKWKMYCDIGRLSLFSSTLSEVRLNVVDGCKTKKSARF